MCIFRKMFCIPSIILYYPYTNMVGTLNYLIMMVLVETCLFDQNNRRLSVILLKSLRSLYGYQNKS